MTTDPTTITSPVQSPIVPGPLPDTDPFSSQILQNALLNEVAQGKMSLQQTPGRTDGVQIIQAHLKALGYKVTHVDSIFGKETRLAVEEFQRHCGRTITGQVDKEVLKLLDAAAQTSPGAKQKINFHLAEYAITHNSISQNVLLFERTAIPIADENIANIQDLLRDLGYDINDQHGRYRGIFGPSTERAIKRFQDEAGLPVTGKIDTRTYKELLERKRLSSLPAGLEKKPGAVISGLCQQIRQTFPIIINAWRQFNGPTPVITSGNDGTHRLDSLHYSNRAIDLRGNNISDETLQFIAKEVKRQLGADYDVIAEIFPGNPSRDHLHIEYQPK